MTHRAAVSSAAARYFDQFTGNDLPRKIIYNGVRYERCLRNGSYSDVRNILLESTVDTLPAHHPLVTRWLKTFVRFDTQRHTIVQVTITIRGQVLE